MSITAHGVTHPGGRPSNEDALVVDSDLGLFVVADGMGGHQAGEVASELAVDTIRQAVAAGQLPRKRLLEQAVQRANERILATAATRADYEGMGTTVVAVLVGRSRAVYASVGDSRIYRWRAGVLTQLTRDDTWVAQAVLAGASVEDVDVREHPMRHVLTSVVGLKVELKPIAAECVFDAGTILLLCSDGLHGSISESRMTATLARSQTVAEIADSLVRQAIGNGATDNVTAIVVRAEP